MLKKENIILLITLFFLNSCGGGWDSFKRAMTNQKQKSIDEFLVKKKDPLVFPPDYENLPMPRESAIREAGERSDIEKLILNESETISDESSGNSTTEQSILKKIKKN